MELGEFEKKRRKNDKKAKTKGGQGWISGLRGQERARSSCNGNHFSSINK